MNPVKFFFSSNSFVYLPLVYWTFTNRKTVGSIELVTPDLSHDCFAKNYQPASDVPSCLMSWSEDVAAKDEILVMVNSGSAFTIVSIGDEYELTSSPSSLDSVLCPETWK